MKLALGMFSALLALIPTTARAAIFGGVEFPLGELSFADSLTSFSPGGGTGGLPIDPIRALGSPDGSFTPLGNAGSLVVEFTDNLLVDQNVVEGGLDLFIFEIGEIEDFSVSISSDGINFIDVGTFMPSSLTTGIDIAPFVDPGDTFRFVRIEDLGAGQAGGNPGADIDAVGAIGSVAVNVDVPEPMAFPGVTMAAGLGCWFFAKRRKSR